MRRLSSVVLALACVGVAFSPSAAFAQAQGSITGAVKDASGAVLPGVTVEVASPALIEKTRSVVTDGSGQYRFTNLFPGSYTVTFMLPGFNTVKREGVEVTGAFVVAINAEMKVGAIEETITVTGETSIVDVQSTTKQRVVTRETMDAVPTSRVPYELAVLVPGVTARNNSGTAAVQDVGGTGGNQAQNGLVSHGSKTTDMRVTYNGVMLATMETGKNAGVLSNTAAYQEITVDSSAVSAELGTGGPRLNLIPREGGNTFRGSLFGSFTNHSLQGNNFTSDLQGRGLATADSMKKLWDFNPGVGGPILRDKLWFFSTVRHNGWQNNPGGFIANSNAGNPNSWAYAPDPARPQSANSKWLDMQGRVTWEATPKNKFAVTYDRQIGVLRTGSATSAPEAVNPSKYDPKSNAFFDWSAPLTNRVLLEAVAVNVYELFQGRPEENPLFSATNPLIGVTDQASGVTYRGTGSSNSHWVNNNYYYRASLAYVTGAHAFKLGFNNAGGTRDALTESKGAPVAYRFNNGVPNQITEQATPYEGISGTDAELGIYAQDRWTIQRMTLSLGVRYDYYKSSFPDQPLGPGPLVPTRNFVIPAQNGVKGWHDLTPKFGVVYDLFGNGKTALRATANKYVQGQSLGGNLPDRPFGFPLNPVSRLVNSTTRSWTDTNRDFIPNCDLTNPLSNGECAAMASSAFGTVAPGATYDPDTLGGWGRRPGWNWEFATGIQHEVLPHVSIDFGYFRRMYGNLLITDNLAAAASDYTTFSIVAPLDPRLPGGGGYTVSGLADLNPNKFGVPTNNLFTYSDNYGKQIDHWNGFDLSANARIRQGVFFQGGVSVGKTTQDNCNVVAKVPEVAFVLPTGANSGNPSVWLPQQYCHYETPMLPEYKMLGVYTLPRGGVQISGAFKSVPGPELAANYVLPTAVAAQTLGRPLSGGAANMTVNLI